VKDATRPADRPHAPDADLLRGAIEELDDSYPGPWALGLIELRARAKTPIRDGWLADAMSRYAAWAGGDDTDRGLLCVQHLAEIAEHVARGGNVGLALPPGVVAVDVEDPVTARACDADDPAWQWSRQGEERGHALYRASGELRQGDLDIPGAPAPVKTRIGGRGFIVCSPSVHPETGEPYTWARELPAETAELPELPEPWAEQLREPRRTNGNGSGDNHAGAGDRISEGQRNATLASLAGTMRRRGMAPEEILAGLRAINSRRCDPPLPEDEVERIAQSVGRYPPGGGKSEQPRDESESVEGEEREAQSEHTTDLGNARRLVAEHGRDLLYVGTHAHWYAWDGARYQRDETGEVVRRAQATVRGLWHEAMSLPKDHDARGRMVMHALRSEGEPSIRRMIALARVQPEVAVRSEDLDAHPELLATPSGTVELGTGELHPPRREDRITRATRAPCDPEAVAPRWEGFLERVLPDVEVRAFVRRAVGYSLLGTTAEHVLLILWGRGANGKSTFLETLLHVLGDYATTTPTETLLAQRETSIPNDLAALRGVRFVTSVETGEGRRLAEAKIKAMTGADTLSARFMRGEWFTFRPQFQLWLATNHKPEVRGTDHAIWRRLRLVPFTETIPEHEQDRELPNRLREEAPGILRWAVQGCLEYRERGLAAPQAVLAATEGYRREQDLLGDFLEERCVVGAGQWVWASELFKAWTTWCEENGEKSGTQKALGERLAERGFEPHKGTKGRRTWRGLGLATGGAA